MKRSSPVIHPSPFQLLKLRVMIVLGLLCMFFFFEEVLSLSTDCLPLYWMLMLTLGFACIKMIHEWVHYLFIIVPQTPVPDRQPTVDVFTTFCAGEPYEMINETLIAIKAITYPHETYLCDEANDPYLIKRCAELGVHHMTRTHKIDAKAGNINNALKKSSGELCLVLDPDHVPFPDFLDPIVAHFNDPQIGFVQVVQSYKNQDQSLIAKGAAQQTYQFYGPMMMTMNKYGTVLAIGANCTFRRKALESIGGHAAGLAEDMHTAMQLHAKGWKSKYIPAVVARGLVPATLSAYYSQQLKWSRGVFELLVTSYPRLFRQFTWQQKLHYGTAPMFYLSGIFYLINFLIPVASLVFNTSPANIDFSNFFTLGLPLATSIILIRHFVQRWVMDEEERGFHLVGGLLMIGSWWVFVLGFYYTLLRKKVPYIPTPKDGNEEDNWRLNIPNILVITISLLSVCYGLYQDYNPYNLLMAGFALMNCLILSFTIAASRQAGFRKYKDVYPALNFIMLQLGTFRGFFWMVRRFIYRGFRGAALILTIMVVCFTLYKIELKAQVQDVSSAVPDRSSILISGIYAPEQTEGLSSMKVADSIAAHYNMHFGIISLYLAWGDQHQEMLPKKLIDSIYRSNAIPMITWEPWQSLFKQNESKSEEFKEKKVFERILSGEYDQYLEQFAGQIAGLNRPVFIRFAHEADNPQYPWSAKGGNTPGEFTAAWRYVHDFFIRKKAGNVIWVWNPWKPEAVNTYFPGREYVDWIGVTNLNYATQNPDHKWYAMDELYMPFHRLAIFNSGIPVMLAEMGSLRSGLNQDKWFKNAFQQIGAKFHEVKAVVFFNAAADKNVVDTTAKSLDWRVKDFNRISGTLKTYRNYSSWISNAPLYRPAPDGDTELHSGMKFRLDEVKGVNYTSDQNWRLNYQNLKKEEIVNDFKQMKEIGINTIKHYGPNVYDRNVLATAAEKNLQVIYSFWLPDRFDYISDTNELQEFADQVLQTVTRLKENKSIIAWNIGNTPLTKMYQHEYKPDLIYSRHAYLVWLNKLVRSIKEADKDRPVSVDVELNENTPVHSALLAEYVPGIDYLGMVTGKDSSLVPPKLAFPYYFSNISPGQLSAAGLEKTGMVLRNWQDQRTENYVSFNGLKDMDGLKKYEFYQLGSLWNKLQPVTPLPALKVLKPAATLVENYLATYHLLNFVNAEWKVLRSSDYDYKYIWWLVKNDKYGNSLQMKKLGEGADITFKIPANQSRYQLYVYVIKGEQVKIIKSTLNTPLY